MLKNATLNYLKTGLFETHFLLRRRCLRLRGTRFCIFPVGFNSPVWMDEDNYKMFLSNAQVDFETVFESVPKDLQIELLYHLDLFR